MSLNHPETIPPTLVPGKTLSKTDPWGQKGWGLLPRIIRVDATIRTREGNLTLENIPKHLLQKSTPPE